MPSEAKVFISHSSRDKEFVRRLIADLRASSVDLWLDEVELKVGDSLRESIERGIKESNWLLVVLSANSVDSPWVRQELNAAFALELSRQSVFILPAVIDQCEIPAFLKDKVYTDFRTSYDEGLQALLDRFAVGSPNRGRLVYSSNDAANLYSGWTLYNTAGISSASIMQVLTDDDKRGFYFRALNSENVGLCLPIRSLVGSATFYYKIVAGDSARQNVFFAMIPMQETGPGRAGYIEVGSDVQDAPQNAWNPHRERHFVPADHYEDATWHRGAIYFDFRDLPGAFYSIFAPRINEGCRRQGPAEVVLGEVCIYSQE
jgi:hypothetical protein